MTVGCGGCNKKLVDMNCGLALCVLDIVKLVMGFSFKFGLSDVMTGYLTSLDE